MLNLSSTPSSKDQQSLEALAILVALRSWKSYWINRRVQLSVRTDNIAALTLVAKMQPHSEALGVIAREMALDISDSVYSPDEVLHIPGVANVAADYLSRISDPHKSINRPAYLLPDLETIVSGRDFAWWRASPLRKWH